MDQPNHIPPAHEPESPAQTPSESPDGSPDRQPDPGSRRAARIALLVFLPLMLIVTISQQMSVQQAQSVPETTEITPPGGGEVGLLISKLYFKIHSQFGAEAGLASDQNMAQLDGTAIGDPVAQFRTAILAAELAGADEGIERLEAVRASLEPTNAEEPGEPDLIETALAGDIDTMLAFYEAPDSAPIDFDELETRHGWFAKVASVFDGRNPDLRERIGGGGGLLVALMLGAFALFGLGFLAGAVLLIVGLIMMVSGKLKPRFEPPAPGGSVYLELVAAFVVAFFCIQIVGGLVAGALSPANGLRASLGLQWLVLGVIFWPLIRGVSRARWAHDLGLSLPQRGKGLYLLKELGAGLIVYIASIPVYVAAALVSFLLLMIREGINAAAGGGGDPAPPPSNPILDLVASVDLLTIFMLVSLATVWAPIVEEVVMRGALFRHMRSRVAAAVAIPASALVFGLLHQYDILLLGPVIALGVVFAFMRHWRGSLIPGIFAHFVHNATVMTLLVSIVLILRD